MLAFVFPGQGSQAVGMGAALAEADPLCRRTFEEADETLGMALSRICFTGPEDQLQLTAIAQPAILATSVAAWRSLTAAGVRPAAIAGHSLGEYSALVAGGALSFPDALRLVRQRGTYMQEAVPVGQGAMAAVIGLTAEILEGICREASQEGLSVTAANLNAPGQIVISGHAAAVDRAVALARERGAGRALRLPVSAPFHCELMRPAADRLAADLNAATFHDLSVPLVTNVDARPITAAADARSALIRQVTAPVRWEQSVRTLRAMGVSSAIEVGPGKVLTGLMRRIEPEISCLAAGDPASVAAAKEISR